jgi:hypothetical protein
MLERDIESHLVKKCKKHNILCYKFTSPQRRNVPDRILIHNGHVMFVELKATNKVPSEAQFRELERLQKSGALAMYANSISQIDHIIASLLDVSSLHS